MKILIVGCNGQLGRDCQTAFGARHELMCLDLPEIDIANPDSIRTAMEQFAPEAVVNCAAYTRVDDAEKHPELCHRVNALGPQYLAQACEAIQARLFHISTDYVFDGLRPLGEVYTEDDTPSPLGVYGATKLAGERPVLAYARGTVLRTAWLYGATGPNFLLTMLRLARRQPPQPIRVVNDQHGTPTWSWRLALQIAHLLEVDAPGLYHATSQGSCTWFVLARRFLEAMGCSVEVVPITTAEYPTPARRPANSVLDNRNLKRAGLDVMIPWEEDLDAFVALNRESWLRRVQS
ncbi:MAG: dTDP-4-dehydrorhamnose reductase [Lentisphaerae bacterium]|jgi:dTDP-4-dehydrorhamnose reductase|nr:dTDP-4-dehydrorhamnose reductase [Lentisphaerota bacterium]